MYRCLHMSDREIATTLLNEIEKSCEMDLFISSFANRH